MEEHHSIIYGPVNALWQGFVRLVGQQERWGDVSIPDHAANGLVVLLFCIAVLVPVARRLDLERPGKFQQMLELIVQGLRGLLDDIIGPGAGKRYLPIIGAFAFFIFLSNITGLFFFLAPPTENPNTTFALSLSAFFYYHFTGVRRHGIGYLKQFLGPIPWLIPLFLPLEIISHFARALSLGLRLFGNIFGEHAATAVFIGMVPILVPMPMMALGIFGAILQTFIFVMLTMVYIAGAEASDH